MRGGAICHVGKWGVGAMPCREVESGDAMQESEVMLCRMPCCARKYGAMQGSVG